MIPYATTYTTPSKNNVSTLIINSCRRVPRTNHMHHTHTHCGCCNGHMHHTHTHRGCCNGHAPAAVGVQHAFVCDHRQRVVHITPCRGSTQLVQNRTHVPVKRCLSGPWVGQKRDAAGGQLLLWETDGVRWECFGIPSDCGSGLTMFTQY